jgi:V-type H+-transporting ATPase subunit a
VLNQTQDHRLRVLASTTKDLQMWTVMVRKMKGIYHALNMFNMDVTEKCLIGECWVPVEDLQKVRHVLTDGSVSASDIFPLKSVLHCAPFYVFVESSWQLHTVLLANN